MPLLRQRPSNFSFKGTSFNGRLLKMDSFTLKNYFISKGFLLVDVKESYEIKDNIANIHFMYTPQANITEERHAL